jgi:protein fuzzy
LQLPFSTVGSLNGVHLFCKTQNVGLEMTNFGDNGLIIWKEYESLLFIGISTNLSEKVLRSLIEKSYQAMIMHVGINEIKNIRNIERFKRDLKSSFYQIVEKLMEFSENDLLDYNECILSSEASTIQEKLIEFNEKAHSPYGFVLSRNRLICATEAFYGLNAADRKLLILLVTQSNVLQKDFPIYLPNNSPTLAYRLISLPLLQGITINLICGAHPTFTELEVLSQDFWQDHYEMLVSSEVNNPRNFPPTVELEPSILGFLLINKLQKKFVISKNVQQVYGKKSSHRMDILRSFYHQIVDVEDFSDSTLHSSDNVQITEQYYTSDYHKCHAIISDECILCVLYLSSIPTYTMQFVTQDLMQKLLNEKSYYL